MRFLKIISFLAFCIACVAQTEAPASNAPASAAKTLPGFDANIVDRYVSYLRRKLGDPPLIETVRGAGFVLGR